MSVAASGRSTLPAVRSTLRNARERLLAERTPDGWWEGCLSSSALSTATACAALALAGDAQDTQRVGAGLTWLASFQNEDGGFGDTTCSPSNLSTTALAWMALGFGTEERQAAARERAADWLRARLGGLGPGELAAGLREVYADDRTFAVPIQVACTVGGCFEASDNPWASIAHLPFELAALPQRLFKWLGLPVVSYALPALIAIGQAVEHHRPSRNPVCRLLRMGTRESTLRTLERIQPPGGGFLEATPLTSFVVLSLIACERRELQVVQHGLEFLRTSCREDGSWPIDTNLATWLSTLAVNALAGPGDVGDYLEEGPRKSLADWLEEQQHLVVHPYTGAAPGGWAWTDLPGGVPDADDTAGAVLAMLHLGTGKRESLRAAAFWLRDLQNRDGGLPTFCKGWGKLPFDASCPDLTAHALRAWEACVEHSHVRPEELQPAKARAQEQLIRTQLADGTWIPLWFGNQHAPGQQNPVYGTSRVLRACGVTGTDAWRDALRCGLRWLLSVQNEDGGFGGAADVPSSVEETALALEALADCARHGLESGAELHEAIARGAAYLAAATEEGTSFDPQPIGLYFAQLWYSEKLYPLIFTISALERCLPLLAGEHTPS